MVIVPDRAPAPDKWTADGKERLLDQHEAAYARAVDRLILAKRTVADRGGAGLHAARRPARMPMPSCGSTARSGCKELSARTCPGELSREGEIKRLAAIEGELDRAAAIKKAWKDKTGPARHPDRDAARARRGRAGGRRSRRPRLTPTVEPWDEPVQLGRSAERAGRGAAAGTSPRRRPISTWRRSGRP